MKTRGCWLIRLYSPDHFKALTLESERGQTVIKLPLSLPYDGETSNCDAAVERFQNCFDQISMGHNEEGGGDQRDRNVTKIQKIFYVGGLILQLIVSLLITS